MLIITSVNTQDVPRDVWEVKVQKDGSEINPHISSPYMTEIVRGRRFILADGSEKVIGLTNKVYKQIGFYFDAIESMQKQMEDDRIISNNVRKELSRSVHLNSLLTQKINKIESMGFIDRLITAFKGF